MFDNLPTYLSEEGSEDELPQVQLGNNHDMNENETTANTDHDQSRFAQSCPQHVSIINNSSSKDTATNSSIDNHPNLDNAGETGHQITIDITLD